MKVKELKALLKDVPDDMQVFLQKDSEGNGYERLYHVDPNSIYIGGGDVYSTEWTAAEACMSVDEWEVFKNEHPRCLVLAP